MQAATHAGHAVLAARGAWATNENSLTRAGLDTVNQIVTDVDASPANLVTAVETTRALCAAALFA